MSAEDNLIRLVMEKGSLDELDALRNLYAGLRMHNEGRHQDKVAQSNLQVQLGLTSNDRDSRRRRMDLAALILDYERNIDIQSIWDFVHGLAGISYPPASPDVPECWEGLVNTPMAHWRGHMAPSLVICDSCGAANLPVRNVCEACAGSLKKNDPTAVPTPKCLECGYIGPYCQEPGTLHEVSCSLYRAPRG